MTRTLTVALNAMSIVLIASSILAFYIIVQADPNLEESGQM